MVNLGDKIESEFILKIVGEDYAYGEVQLYRKFLRWNCLVSYRFPNRDTIFFPCSVYDLE